METSRSAALHRPNHLETQEGPQVLVTPTDPESTTKDQGVVMNPSTKVLADEARGYLDAENVLAPAAQRNRRPIASTLLRTFHFTGTDYSSGFRLRLEDELLDDEHREIR